MRLFDRRSSSPPRSGWRDAGARFLHDLAVNGVPMSLQSLKASCDLAAKTTARRTGIAAQPTSPFQLAQPVGPVAGLV